MKSCPALALTVAAAITASPHVMAQTQKYVVLDNVTAVAGQAAVNGKAAIPLQGTAQLDGASGNVIVACKKGVEGAPAGECSNVGTGSGTAPDAPTVNLSGPSAVTATGSKLTWTSTGADVCYGLSADVSAGVGPAVAGWSKEWPANNPTSGFSLDAVLSGLPQINTAVTYDFTLRCYSTPTTLSGATRIAAVTDQTQQVTLTRISAPVINSCQTYYDSLTTAEKAHFDAYKAENRGFTRVEKTFTEQTTRVLGAYTGQLGPNATPVLPGLMAQQRYLALTFSMPLPNVSNTGKFGMNTQEAVGSVQMHPIIITISPCPGDFRPRVLTGSNDPYLSPVCRTIYDSSGQSVRGADPSIDSARCLTPAGQTMYMNVATQDMYTTPGQTIPNSYCPGNVWCGAGALIGN